MKAIVLLNAKAGTLVSAQSTDASDRLRGAFAAEGVEARFQGVPGHQLAAAAREALEQRPDAVVAGGGDGTVSAVASALVNTGVPLGVVPLGTLNHFARDLGIPLEPEEAARCIARGHTRPVDAAAVNGKTFINNSSIGIYPHLVRHRDQQQERLGRGKWLAMLVAVLGVFKRYPYFNVRISTDTDVLPRTTPFIFVGNNAYDLSLFSVGQRPRLDAGRLSLYIANHTGRWGMLALALRAALGRLEQSRDFESVEVEQVWIENRRPRLLVAADGEIEHLAPPLHYRILPAALKVIVPA